MCADTAKFPSGGQRVPRSSHCSVYSMTEKAHIFDVQLAVHAARDLIQDEVWGGFRRGYLGEVTLQLRVD